MSKAKPRVWLERIKQVSGRQALAILALAGLAVYGIGLAGPFQGDDNPQIVLSEPVHSLGHIGTLFTHSTFFNGRELTGSYYRPLMTLVYAIIYSLFGPHPVAFHVVQLLFFVTAAWLLFMILRRFFAPHWALLLAVIFVVHPLNSQTALAIPSMQDALMGCFGFLGLWLLMSKSGKRGLWISAASFFLAMLSKESGIVFILLGGLYLALFERGRLKEFGLIILAPLAAYGLLRLNALGLHQPGSQVAPIDHLNLFQRLLTLPSIILFYLNKALLPWNLATRYYWTQPAFSIRFVVLPLMADLAVLAAGIWIWCRLGPSKERNVFAWFATWVVLGMLPYLQLVPLDMTACATWFLVPLAGLLGMAAAAGRLFPKPPRPLALAVTYAVLLAALSAVQAAYYRDPVRLARHDLAVSPQDYAAMGEIAKGLIDEGKYGDAIGYAERSAELEPTMFNYQNLGVALQRTGDYTGARRAYESALRYGSQATLYEDLGLIALETDGDYKSTSRLFDLGLASYPQDFKLWVFDALYQDSKGHNDKAQEAITSAAQYGQVPQQLSDAIMNNQPFTLPLPGTDKSVVVK